MIRDFIQKEMIICGVSAYMQARSKLIYHSTRQISQRLLLEEKDEIKHLPKMEQQSGEVVIDCNQFPGCDPSYRGLCFTSCWGMYYSRYYHRIIPKLISPGIQQVEKMKELGSEAICTQLYRDLFNWQKPNS